MMQKRKENLELLETSIIMLEMLVCMVESWKLFA